MYMYQQQFLEFAIAREVLRFGEFTLKSGRHSPYFFNAGILNSGAELVFTGESYAAAIQHWGGAFDMLFGPAYKGIPLAVATAMALAGKSQRDVPVAYNRKEIKAHGEGGALVGAPLRGRVLIIDDVITAGTAIREALALIQASGASVAGVVVALDRQERGQGEYSAVQEVEREFAIPVIPIIAMADILAYAQATPALTQHAQAIHAYRARYGV